jgi:hypothetical protein
MRGLVREAKQTDIDEMLDDGLRPADLLEIKSTGYSPRQSLERGLRRSLPCLAVEVDGKCCGMFGVVADIRYELAGNIWFLGTDRIQKVKIQFLRESERWLEEITKNYRSVSNYIHQDNTLHIKWLKWLGFSFFKKVGPFIEFGRITNV